MGYIIAYAIVFLLAATPFFEVVAVIPLGALAGLQTWLVVIIGLLGNVVTVLLVIVLMDQIKAWLQRRREKKGKAPNKRGARAEKIWKKYGLPGLAFLGPILVGSHLAAFLSMSFGGERKAVAVWMMISLVCWATVTGILTFYGVDFIVDRSESDGFLIDLLQRYS
ncbi:small multi-drug export protein [Alkalihalobacillus oceani]|uniref:small multi-drug export protein n=1 Tax=Halalkalibacter oceani TaxID=1653776 RepID=UPI0020406623|nr:small multi-drug export protein [Halalkalibacter oceani]MCM3759254.1 small multi-drug export protein [Halalkalibacter oceani]